MSVVGRLAGRRRLLRTLSACGLAVTAVFNPIPAGAAITSSQIAADPFTQATCKGSATTNHHANVEPDTFSYGSTMVAAFQVGRIYDGGACAIGFATSRDNGSTWPTTTSGLLPG